MKGPALRLILFFGFCMVGFGALLQSAYAATLLFTPSAGSYAAGSTFTMTVSVSSADQAMNAASGVVSFPHDKLEVVSLSKNKSIFSLWVQEPSFSNGDGTVTFEGIVMNPGYVGIGGKIISITFKAKAAGRASLTFASGSVLANDGKGTNIITDLGIAALDLNKASSASSEAAKEVAGAGTPSAPVVSSPTHPDEGKWYSDPTPIFQWLLPKGTTDVSFAVDDKPQTKPEKVRGLASSFTYPVIDDGIWYFHIRLRNAAGWGRAAHFKFGIDTQAPRPMTIAFPHGSVVADNRPVVLFNTTDGLSGIDHYEVKIGDQSYYRVLPGDIVESNPHVIPAQTPGTYSIGIIAYDKAGNSSKADSAFEVIGLVPPRLTHIPENILEYDLLKIEGRTYPKATVIAILQTQKGNEEVGRETAFTNSLGQFSLIWPTHLDTGSYALAVLVVDENGNKSVPTGQLIFKVKSKNLLNIGPIRLTYSTGIALISLFLISFAGFYLRAKKIRSMEDELRDVILTLGKDSTKKNKDNAHAIIEELVGKVGRILKNIHRL